MNSCFTHWIVFGVLLIYCGVSLREADAEDSESKPIEIISRRGIRTEDMISGLSGRIAVVNHGQDSRRVKLAMNIRIQPNLATETLRGVAISFPDLQIGDKIPIADRILTVAYIGGNGPEHEMLEFQEPRSALKGLEKCELFSVPESDRDKFSGLRVGDSGLRVQEIGADASGKQFVVLDVRERIAEYSKKVSLGDHLVCGEARFELIEIVPQMKKGNRLGWIVLRMEKM